MPDLDQIRIVLQGIGYSLRNNRLFVPKYQRSYAWTEKQVTDYFTDITSAIIENKKEYFLGSVVVSYKDPTRPEVVDGQQRLATTLIFLAAIADYFHKHNEHQRLNEISNRYLVDTDLESLETSQKLHMNDSDNNFFYNRILLPLDDPRRNISPTKDSHRRINNAAISAAKHIERYANITREPSIKLAQLVKFLEESVKVIWVTVPDDTDAFKIFETLNDRGLRLAVSDLMKNYLFSLSGTRVDEAQKSWISMTGALETATINNEDMVVTFIRHLWSSKYGITRERELYEKVKGKITSKQAAISFAEELEQGSHLYVAIMQTSNEFWSDYGQTAREHMETLNELGMIQIRPLLLAILSKFSVVEAKKCLKLFVSWSVRFLIHGGLGGGALESSYCQRAKEIWEGQIDTAKGLLDAMKKTVPTDIEFGTAFQTATVSKQFLARYYLRVLEKQEKKQPQPENIPNPNAEVITLEHILPLNPSPAWGHIDPEKAEAHHSRIGNLALLQQKINSDIGNAGFSAKKRFYKNSDYLLTSSLQKYDSWGIEEIEDRQKRLAELAVEAWPNKL
jgi:uncharacterized protein with ParB-like and HNH nuclease domain